MTNWGFARTESPLVPTVQSPSPLWGLDSPFNGDMMIPVAVAGDTIKTVCTYSLSFVSTRLKVFMKDCHQRVVASGFFIGPIAVTVLHTIASTHDCGGVEGKRFSLTQGGRLHEGSAPSDKRLNRLMNCGDYRIVGSINKAAELDKGQTPSRTPQRGDV